MVNLLEILPEYVLSWLVMHGRERHVATDEVLFSEGASATSLFLVLDGLLGLTLVSHGEKRVGHASPGSIVGEMSLVSDEPAAATVTAEEPSLVLEISRETINEKLDHDHVFAADFYRVLLTYTTRMLREGTLKLHAAERALAMDVSQNPSVKRAQTAIDLFKKTMVELDKEALKNGSIAEERYQQFRSQSHELMTVSHEILGSGSALDDVMKQQISIRLQNEILPYVLATETAERFYSKPRGYAGDFLAIHNIYRNEPAGTGRLGPIVDRMFLETPPSVAVRNRRKLFTEEIIRSVESRKEECANILCMASGPATEVFDAFAGLPDKSRLKATLMDIDLHALAFVDEARSRHKLGTAITLVNENLIALFLGRGKTRVEPQDLIYSIGLIDYLNDRLVGKLLQYVYSNLAPGGRVILGNFHPRNPAKEFMDSVLEWNLIHRDEHDMDRLFKASPFNRACTQIRFEEQGINLFAECVKQ